ncbi:MAG: tyrosine--tRNA ligase, partial [Planctomycetia bacterium]
GLWLAGRRDALAAAGAPCHVYCGFDPTADSLHVGHLLPVLGLRRFKAAGFLPIAVVGGATGMFGDPSGKAAERTLLDRDALAANVAGLSVQLERLFEGTVGRDFLLVNNADWFRDVTFVDFLRDVGKHFSVNAMMAKDSVRSRLEDREQGISYTEFSYMLLQSYDYLHLYETYGCLLQIGGSDQWGNITGGMDLIRRKHPEAEVAGCTFPLLTTAGGQKFGKSEGGAIWLDPRRTHPYFFYKYFFNADDADVMKFLFYFTFLSFEELADVERRIAEAPHLRTGQKTLAREMTALAHGRGVAEACEGLEQAMHADDAAAFELHAGPLGLLEPPPADASSEAAEATLPVAHRPASMLAGAGLDVVDLVVELGLFKSKGDAKREITGPNSGLYVAGVQIRDMDQKLTTASLAGRKVIQVRKGKKNKRMVCFYDA